ncbi:MAG: hypothetical protein M1826_004790 [Phylliscum demangeonii]|nr:MAG: hypothetical protein M1826_004790 [Phylliscum demangeonii]
MILRNQDTYAPLREQYAQYGKGILEAAEDRATFISNLHSLREYVIAQADVIVTPCSNAAEGFVTRSCHPDVLFVDKAAKATELDLVIPIAFYGPRFVVLIGDEKQLRPTVKTYGKRIPEKKAYDPEQAQAAEIAIIVLHQAQCEPYTGLPFSQSSSSPPAPGTPRRGRGSALGLIVAPPSSLPEPPALAAAVGASVSGVARSPSVRLERSTLTLFDTLFEERALRVEPRDNANDAAVALGKLRELNLRLRVMEKATEELADIKAAAMTSTTELAEAKARFRKQDQDLQRLRAQLRLAEQRADYYQRCRKDGENDADLAPGCAG